ncbi:MAG: 4Fe-4S binding protein [Dehalococcoidales bacterium]|nr:4Fe-4S binding protein [Dehalococcoidales bacterium]
MSKQIRKIVRIDEEKCNGCGACAIKCAEGALQIIDGKAKLISDNYCDGLGDCLGECPQGAITIEERPADAFDLVAVQQREAVHAHAQVQSCPSAAATSFKNSPFAAGDTATPIPAYLTHWPVQLTLVPDAAPFFQDTDLMLAAHCVPFTYAAFHRDFLAGHTLVIACPKLDDFAAHQQKLTDLLTKSRIKSLTIVHMEVPCCSGLVYLAKQAIKASGKNIPLREVTIGIRGDVKADNC